MGRARKWDTRCGLRDRIGDIRQQVEAAGWDVCVVLKEHDILMGLLRVQELGADAESSVEQVMRPGPATYRPNALVADVLRHLHERRVQGVLITRLDGTLLGWLRTRDAERTTESL